ncbi:MAG: nucleotidyltransferase domain-containing protein [Vicinamibacterales bacterium]
MRSLTSPLLKWPDRAAVEAALHAWVERAAAAHPDVLAIAAFGSFARGEWAFGSDLDLLVVVHDAGEPSSERRLSWDTSALPVPVDLLLYSASEWRRLHSTPSRFRDTLAKEARWVLGGAPT